MPLESPHCAHRRESGPGREELKGEKKAHRFDVHCANRTGDQMGETAYQQPHQGQGREDPPGTAMVLPGPPLPGRGLCDSHRRIAIWHGRDPSCGWGTCSLVRARMVESRHGDPQGSARRPRLASGMGTVDYSHCRRRLVATVKKRSDMHRSVGRHGSAFRLKKVSRAFPCHERLVRRDRFAARKCHGEYDGRALRGRHQFRGRCVIKALAGSPSPRTSSQCFSTAVAATVGIVLLGLAPRGNEGYVECSGHGGNWAGRLRQDGGSAFAALGPARRLAALKGKGKGKPQGKGKPTAPAPAQQVSERSPSACLAFACGASSSASSSTSKPGGPTADTACLKVPIESSLVTLPAKDKKGDDTAKGRRDFPNVRTKAKVSRKDVIAAAKDVVQRERMLKAFDEDIRSVSSAATSTSTWNTWKGYHDAWFGESVPVVPLTPESIRGVAACFKEGGYSSFAPYLSKAKEIHVLEGFEWSILLDMCGRKATHSVLRGVGAARQSKPFDLSKAITALEEGDVELPAEAPIGWRNLLVLGTAFIMREIEIAYALAAHLSVDRKAARITLLLPVSKKDPRAVGCQRSWACLCGAKPASRPDCPYHAGLKQLAVLKEVFGSPLPTDLPLFPTRTAAHADKAVVVSGLEATVIGYGGEITGINGGRLYGGHSFRVTGAQKLASLGVEIIKIMVMARWAGETVLRYVKEAPVDNLPDEVLALEGRRDLLKTLGKLADGAENLTSKVGDLEAQLVELKKQKDEQVRTIEAKYVVPPPLPYVTNGANSAKTLKVHRVLAEGAELPPLMWRTRCGYRFAFANFTRHGTLDGFNGNALCKSCGLQQKEEHGNDEVVSGTDSDSGHSENTSSSS